MMIELKTLEFNKCKVLLNEEGLLEAKAVIEGINPGRIFVDDIAFPTSGIIWLGNNDGFLFIGDEKNEAFNNELNSFIDKVIKPEATKVGLAWFEGVGNHRKWNKTIKKVFEHRKLGSWNQRVYTLHKDDDSYNDELAMEQGYKIVRICKRTFKNSDNSIKNIEFLHSKILESWSSSEKFFREGIGYCAVYNHEIASICFSSFVFGNVHCIDIETLAEHQGKKLAQKIALAFVKDCLDNNMVPYWDCMESNKPSVAVAENIGLKKVFSYIGYEFSLE